MTDEIEIQATTLDWGVPFYTKVQTSAAVGEGPDVMTYHTSRIPLAVSQNILQEITADDWTALGLGQGDFATAVWEAVDVDGKQYAVPFDTHPIVLYYNKDKLAAAGLIGDDGQPTGLDGIENFSAAMKKLQDGGTKYGMSTFNAAGDFQFRTIYSLLCQQDGEMLTDGVWLAGDNLDKLTNAVKVVSDWVTDGYAPAYTEYPAAIALFTSGESAMHINGVWEVPTFTDLAAKGEARLRVGRDRAAGVLQPRLHLFGLARLRDPEQRRQGDVAGEAGGGAQGDRRDRRTRACSGRPPATSRRSSR